MKLNYTILVNYCVCMNVRVHVLSHVRFFVTPRIIAHQVLLFIEFSRLEYWKQLPFPTPGNLPNQPRDRTNVSCVSCIGRWILTTVLTGKPIIIVIFLKTCILECNYNFIQYTGEEIQNVHQKVHIFSRLRKNKI